MATFFSTDNFPSRLCSDLFRTALLFVEATSSHFFKVTTLTQQLFCRSCHFSRAVTFSEELLFQNNFFFLGIASFFRVKLLLSSHFLRKSSFSGQLLCRNSYFVRSVTLPELLLWEELVRNKDIHIKAAFSNQVLLHSINFFRIDIFFNKGT